MRVRDQLMASLEEVAKLAGQNAAAKRAQERGVDLHWPQETNEDTKREQSFADLFGSWFR